MVGKILKYLGVGFVIAFFIYAFYMMFIYKGYNPPERNRLVFEDSIERIEDSIKVFKQLVKHHRSKYYIYVSERGDFEDYEYKNYRLYVNTYDTIMEIGHLTDTDLYKKIDTAIFKIKDPKRFVNLVLFFEKNHLNGAYKEGDVILFYYRGHFDMGDFFRDLERFVVYAEDKSEIEFLLKDNIIEDDVGNVTNLAYKILDHKGHLYLLAFKDAEIWEN